MNIDISYIMISLLGALIGYIANDIAIRMLFRLHKTKYVLSLHASFNQGVIPKELGRTANVIGGVISENLLNKEVLERYLLSDDMVGRGVRLLKSLLKFRVTEMRP